jgi:hypothetical protein
MLEANHCGPDPTSPGELSLFLDSRGHRVLGVEFAPRAILRTRSGPARSYGIAPGEVRERVGSDPAWRSSPCTRRCSSDYSENGAYVAVVRR